MVEQQLDAQYIRKQLEDVHNPPNGSKPKEKLSTDKKKAKESASLFGTTVEESDKNKGGGKNRGTYKKPYCIFFEAVGHPSTF